MANQELRVGDVTKDPALLRPGMRVQYLNGSVQRTLRTHDGEKWWNTAGTYVTDGFLANNGVTIIALPAPAAAKPAAPACAHRGRYKLDDETPWRCNSCDKDMDGPTPMRSAVLLWCEVCKDKDANCGTCGGLCVDAAPPAPPPPRCSPGCGPAQPCRVSACCPVYREEMAGYNMVMADKSCLCGAPDPNSAAAGCMEVVGHDGPCSFYDPPAREPRIGALSWGYAVVCGGLSTGRGR